jgi:hypothetical protein
MATERVAVVRRVRLGVSGGELARLIARVRECRGAQVGGGVVPAGVVDELIDYWVDRYDWRAHEDRLNAYEHFATEIAGQFVHFMHARAADPTAEAVLLTHVWPSGVMDVVEAAASLRSTHHLVMPSIAWTALTEPAGWGELMRRLGYDEYVVRDDRGQAPPPTTALTSERRGLRPEELAEVRWFNQNLNAVTEEQQLRALVLSAAMLARSADRDAVLTGVMLAWFVPRLQAEQAGAVGPADRA